MARYYHKVKRSEILPPFYDDQNPDHVILPDDNVFWSELPEGEELVYDVDGIPTGTQPIVDVEYQMRIDLMNNGVTLQRITVELFKDSQGLPNDLATIYSAIQTIATTYSKTYGEVISVLG